MNKDHEKSARNKDQSTEAIILQAARKVFLRKGLDGARMQEIADEAHINKALLHYYFRSKDKLFEAIFLEAISQFIPSVMDVMGSGLPFAGKLELLVDSYLRMLKQNPYIPMFILHEINRDPARIVNLFRQSGIRPELVIARLRSEIGEGIVADHSPYHIIVNILSMCIFPFAAKPILKGILFGGDEGLYDQFLDERKAEIIKFVKSALGIL